MTHFAPDSDHSILSHTYHNVLVLYGYHFLVWQQRGSLSPCISEHPRWSSCSVSILKYVSVLTRMGPYMCFIRPNSMSLSQRTVQTFTAWDGNILASICGWAMFILRNSPWYITCDTPTSVYRLVSSCIHLYLLISDFVLSSSHTSTESIA
jgi:hypothetical protein